MVSRCVHDTSLVHCHREHSIYRELNLDSPGSDHRRIPVWRSCRRAWTEAATRALLAGSAVTRRERRIPPVLKKSRRVIAFEESDCLLFYRWDEIASLTPEYRGRWRAVAADGTVLHRPSCPPGDHWCALGESLVNPRLLRMVGEKQWKDPADFVYCGELVGEPEPEPDWPREVTGLLLGPDGNYQWISDGQPVPHTGTLEEALELHPQLVSLGKQGWVNPYRLRALRRKDDRYTIELDNGQVLATLNRTTARSLASGLGLPGPDRLGEVPCLLTQRNLRDYPLELDRTSAAQLKLWFKTARQALSNIIYQTVRYRQQGKTLDGYGTDHSGYLYKPIYSTMVRAGFWKTEDISRMDSKLRNDFEVVLNDLVGRDALFTYQQLGFLDDPSRRHIGDRRPEIVLVLEKTGFRRYAEEFSRRYGISFLITGGMPKLLDSEFLALALAQVVTGPIRIIAFTDFDPAGWALAASLAAHLARYGIQLSGPIVYLVRPEVFTAEEIELFSFDCPMASPATTTYALEWAERSGGIDGKPRGIHANHFQPLERVAAELQRHL